MRVSLWLILILTLLSSGCSLLPDEKDKTAGWSAQKLYVEATDQMKSGNYKKSIEYYRTLESRYPFGRYAMQAKLNIAYAHYKLNESDQAIAAVDRFLKLHPDHAAAAYAYYLKALVHFDRNVGFFARFLPTDNSQRDPGSTKEAYTGFQELIELYPDTEYAEDARLRILYLHNNLARHEIHVAKYYMDRQAYLAAAGRAKSVIENYSKAPAARDALQILVAAYTELGMPELAADARRVLEINEARGYFVEDPFKVGERTLGEEIWDYLGLDEN
ncbi:MAG: outer membrane protein assembly factor BamD [bacterium]